MTGSAENSNARDAPRVGGASRHSALSDEDIVYAMRRGEESAFVEFIERFRMLCWNQARSLRVPRAERRSWTEEILHDCALAVVQPGAPGPANLAGYIVVAMKRRAVDDFRRRRSASALRDALAQEQPLLRTGSTDDLPAAVPEPVLRLAEEISKTLSSGEELLLTWKGHRVSYSTIAGWLREKRLTVAQRTWRLARRVRRDSEEILRKFSDADREVIRRFLDGGKEK